MLTQGCPVNSYFNGLNNGNKIESKPGQDSNTAVHYNAINVQHVNAQVVEADNIP